MTSPARCYVEISRSQIAANYRAIQDAVGQGVQVMGVVKAEAYGHGMLEVSRIPGCLRSQMAGGKHRRGGVTLRRAGIGTQILIMAGLLKPDWAIAVALRFDTRRAFDPGHHCFDEAAMSAGKHLPFHLKLDTGMAASGHARESIRDCGSDAESALQYMRRRAVHFASASDFTTLQTSQQIQRFEELTDLLRQFGVAPDYFHISSTNAIAYARPDAWRAIVRPGHALYGYVSPARGAAPPQSIAVAPALSWKVKIVAVKDIPANTPVGYGGSAITKRPTRIAILGAGYADGVPHRLSNRGRVIAGGKFAPILGTVSMDLTTIDITGSPTLKPGDDVTLIGREGSVSQNAQEIARVAGTISYNVLCGIKSRVERVYID